MRASQIIVAGMALFFVVDLLVGDEDGVLTNLQETSGHRGASEVSPPPPAVLVAQPVPPEEADSNPWGIEEDSPSLEAGETSDGQDFANEGLAEEPLPREQRAPLQPQAGSPEFPTIPLSKPQLAAAGAKIDYGQSSTP